MTGNSHSINDRTEVSPSSKGFDPESFSYALDTCAQWAMKYIGSLKDRDVSEQIERGSIFDQFPASPPQHGVGLDEWEKILKEVESVIEPGLVHWQSPRFFAYFPCNSSMPGIMGDFVSSVMNVNGMLWSTSPSVTEVEMRMMDWCAELFGLPSSFRFVGDGSVGGGCIQGTASESVVSVISAARKRKVNAGKDRSTMCVYTSVHAHSSIVKGAMVCGLADDAEDRSRVRLIESRDGLGLDPDLLIQAVRRDLDAGLTPCMVCVSRGTTSTGAMDPLMEVGEKLAELSDEDRPWLHVDSAWAGAAAVCPEHRDVLEGVEWADSVCINPHKWLLTNFDCDLFWVRDRSALVDSMAITPAYLREEQVGTGEVIDYRDWHVPLGRRFRAIKLWFVIRWFGVEGLQAHIRHHVELAQYFERFVSKEDSLVLACDRSLSLVCFYVQGDSDRTRRLIESVNARRKVMISHTIVPVTFDGQTENRWVARVAIGASMTTRQDVDVLIGEIRAALGD